MNAFKKTFFKNKVTIFAACLVLSFSCVLAAPYTALAADCSTSSSTKNASQDTKSSPTISTPTTQEINQCLKGNPLIGDINKIVNFLSAGVGIVVVSMLILGGIQYSIAGDNANAVTAARQRITNALLALVVFLLIWAFLQWLIPGGLFS